MFYSLWPTNILAKSVPELQPDNAELYEIGKRIYLANAETKDIKSNDRTALQLMHHKSPALLRFYEQVRVHVRLYIENFYPALDYERLNFEYSMFVSLQNRSNRWILPHKHVSHQLVATYYPKFFKAEGETQKFSGAVTFHDPRPVHPNWMLQNENKFLIQEITEGTLIVFPGFAEHSTFPFFDDDSEKLALITNIRFHLKSQKHPGKMMTHEEIMALQNL